MKCFPCQTLNTLGMKKFATARTTIYLRGAECVPAMETASGGLSALQGPPGLTGDS